MAMTLENGSRVAIIGGGPAGSLCAYFLLTFARRMEMDLAVDIFEPRDFGQPGPGGCNMCGGIVSESLVQALAVEGIELPANVVQRGIDSYVLHTDETAVRIDTPLHERRIAAVHRGGGPRDVSEVTFGGIDGHLMALAQELGAKVVRTRVREVDWQEGLPRVSHGKSSQTYDLLVGAFGVNSAGGQLLEQLGFKDKGPTTTKAYITELNLGHEVINQYFGSSMHVFLLNIPRLDFAAIVPKGEFVTVCLLGRDIDRELVDAFFESQAVKDCFPPSYSPQEGACHCSPRINIREADRPFMDRVVLVGDGGATRLYKDGIGAAYRTAKAAALTAVFSGVSAQDFQKHYLPAYRSIAHDNRYGLVTFAVVHEIKRVRPLIRGTVRMTAREQARSGNTRSMSMVLWDMFTGSSPYRDIFFRTLAPGFVGRLTWESALSLWGNGRKNGAGDARRIAG
ncbi:MAG: hypothetical protein HY680_01520 [Chloroflexi bacterium]|nr:hypothetical protein [Chloroflexota bacterium]